MAIDFDTLFANLGKAFYAQELVNTARGTTIVPEVKDFLDQFGSSSIELKEAVSGVTGGLRSMQSGMSSQMTALQRAASNVIIQVVDDDVTIERKDITTALREIIRQMVAGMETIDASTAAASASGPSGDGDGVLVTSAKRPDGKNAENALAEAITFECTADSSPATATFSAKGDARISDRLSSDWPGGSGIQRTLQAIDAANSLLANGSFEDEDDIANVPDGWAVSVGTVGTTLKITDVEVQQIAITGSPSAGYYIINVTNAAGKVQSTAPLAYDATESDVEAAITLLVGFEDVTVASTGTSPNFTHVITYNGVAGNLSNVSVTNGTTGGSFSISQVTAGSAHSYVGKALEFDSDGSQLTTIQVPVSLKPLTQYAFNGWFKADSVPAAGVLTVDFVDGIGGSVIADQAGTSNSFTISCTGLSTSFAARNGSFRTPKALPPLTYLRIRITTAVSNTSSIFIDHCSLAEMTELYPDGPSAAIFSGAARFFKGDGQVLGDKFTLTVTNDRAGKFQEWFERNFDMRSKGLLLPSDSSGSETLLDSLIG
jgi:hypothetical protein